METRLGLTSMWAARAAYVVRRVSNDPDVGGPKTCAAPIAILMHSERHQVRTIKRVVAVHAPSKGLPQAEVPQLQLGGEMQIASPQRHTHVLPRTHDFVFDTCADGRTLKCLTVIDQFTRECLAIDVAGGIRSGRVIELVTQLVSVHGAPRSLRSDNGPEFVARAILRWLRTAQIETAFIDPGKPWQNGAADESFNGKFRDQHLSLQWFRNRLDAKVSIEAWRRHYNEVRPHSSLGYLTPAAFKAKHVADVEGGRSPAVPARANKITEERLTDRPGVILQ